MGIEDPTPDSLQIECNANNAGIIRKFRKVARDYIDKHQYYSALFWSDKLVTLSNGAIEDVYRFAQCLYLTKQYHRATNLLQSRKLDKTDLKCCYLAAKSIHEAKDHEEALFILDNGQELIEAAQRKLPNLNDEAKDNMHQILSSIFLLRGRVFEALDNRSLATEAFKAALKEDVYCHEAFQALVQHQMLTAEEESELLESLTLDKQCEEDEEVVKFLYEISLKKYDKPSDLSVPKNLSCLSSNTDVMIAQAERHYYNCDYTECFNITSNVMKVDQFHSECLPVHITCLIELSKSNELFLLAHKLVDIYPEWAVSWFAVGCYYYLVGKHEPARRYLSKSTQLDRVFGPAWLVYGHSFATENEHDQAMAAYFKACQLMKGCHLPLLYIGVEYSLTNNSKLAERFFTQALKIAPKDPFVLHELGAISFQNQEYLTAEKFCAEALAEIQQVQGSVMSTKWEALLNNLGHISRKLGKYQEALEYHQQALVLQPINASTYSAIGCVQSLMGNLVEAVESFHKALGLRRDDAFSTTMLNNVIEQLMNEVPPFSGCPEEIERFELPPEGSHLKVALGTNVSDTSLDFEMADATGDTTGGSDVTME